MHTSCFGAFVQAFDGFLNILKNPQFVLWLISNISEPCTCSHLNTFTSAILFWHYPNVMDSFLIASCHNGLWIFFLNLVTLKCFKFLLCWEVVLWCKTFTVVFSVFVFSTGGRWNMIYGVAPASDSAQRRWSFRDFLYTKVIPRHQRTANVSRDNIHLPAQQGPTQNVRRPVSKVT